MSGTNNRGNFPNDCFDESLYNADAFVMRRDDNQEWVSWCVIVGRKNLEDGHEVFIKYGREYWCYLGNINSLSAESRLKCMEFYNIKETDLFDCEKEPERVHGSSSDNQKKVRALQKALDASNKKKASKV